VKLEIGKEYQDIDKRGEGDLNGEKFYRGR
jgi:hypothetical protein